MTDTRDVIPIDPVLGDYPERACRTPDHELREGRRKCWVPSCTRTSRLEWCGWKYCLRHYWSHVLRQGQTLGHLWVKIRFTRIARH